MPDHYISVGAAGDSCQHESISGLCLYNDVPGTICDFKSDDGFCGRISGTNIPSPRSHWLPMRDGERYSCFYLQRSNRTCLLLNDTCSQMNSFGQCVCVGERESLDFFEGTIVNEHIDCCHNGQDFRCQCLSDCCSKSPDGLCTRGLPVSLNTRGLGLGASTSRRPYVVPSIEPSQPETGDQLQQMFHELVSSPASRQRLRGLAQETVDAPDFDPFDDDPEYVRNQAQRRVSGITTPRPLLKIECRDTDCKWNNKNVCFSVRAIMDQEHRCQCFEPKDPGTDKEYTSPISNIEL
jgi:hypothetical protein